MDDATTLEHNRKNDALAENLLRAAGLSGDDLKSLAHVFKDASSHFCARLKQGSAAAFDAETGSVESTDKTAFNDIFDKAAIITPLKAERWGCSLYLALDAVLVFSVIEAMFGAQGNLGPVDADHPSAWWSRKSQIFWQAILRARWTGFSIPAPASRYLRPAIVSIRRISTVKTSSFPGFSPAASR